MCIYTFKIAGIAVSLEVERKIRITEPFVSFLEEDRDDIHYHAVYREVSKLPCFSEEVLKHAIDYDVFQEEDGYVRRFHDHRRDDRPYAAARLFPEKRQIRIEYLPEGRCFLNESGNCFFHLMWEKVLSVEKRIILHASCIESRYGGILFSGASGIGKSTQSELWCRYENARLLNGDRPILWKRNGEWRAYGSPYAGSSGVYRNESCPVSAIVMLRQASYCGLRKLQTAEAFRSIFRGLTVNTWDRQFASTASEAAADLAVCVPVYELFCTPDQRAVELLRMELSKEGGRWNQRK